MDVLCIGNASYDMYYPVDTFPEENRKYSSNVFLEACGGPAANGAYLLGIWGVSAGFAGCVGVDQFGSVIKNEFQSAGVDIELVDSPSGFHTPLSWIITGNRNGSRTILNRRHFDVQMEYDEPVLQKKQPRFLLFDGHELDASLDALRLFPGAVSVLDAGSLRESARVLAGKVTHLLCSESFAAAYCCARGGDNRQRLTDSSSRLEAARRLMELNPRPGCITLGEEGLVFWEDERIFYMPPFIVQPVDTTAAGDIFHGAFIYALCRPKGDEFSTPFRQALLFASAAAALSVTKPGGRPSIPNVPEVDRFIAEQEESGGLPSISIKELSV